MITIIFLVDEVGIDSEDQLSQCDAMKGFLGHRTLSVRTGEVPGELDKLVTLSG